ncbi:MAG: CHAP domain-containing protein [Lachnospiraceae bacterium]|nr:CHAP domain-containing protein [Lachnospiraceae bacterium]
MKQDALQQTSKYAKAHQRKRRWYKAVSCLAAVVVFCTTYALILPAITMEQDAKCGIPEHVHDENCYIVVSEPHVHDESCYELVGGHTHTDDCYTLQRGELICGQEEREGHHHTDACYTETTTLVCGLEEDENHQHTAACYETTRELTCGLEESGGHQHTDECYAWEQVLTCGQEESEGQLVLTCNLEEGEVTTTISDTPVCGLEEHTHTLACYSDPAADVETAQIWERAIKNVELTGDWREDVIAIAKTQLGYQESAKNYIVLEDGETIKGYTRYGAWYGDPYGDWCAMFASFVLNYAEVEGIPLDANCQHWIETLSNKENDLYRPADEYLPQPGDLVFFDFDIEDEAPTADHVGLVVEIMNDEDENPIKLKTIEGDSSDKVQYVTYELDDPAILGYGQLPEQEPEDEEPAEQFVLTAESEDGIAVTVTGDPESLPYPVEEITLSVQPVTDEDVIALWKQTVEEAGENAEEAFLLDIALLHDGEEIEPAGPVQVTFEGVETGDNDELTVFHVDAENEETEDMNAVVDEAGTVVLDTDHFSVYGGLVSVSGQTQKMPQPGEYVYLDLSALGGYYPNDGYELGFFYHDSNNGERKVTNYENVSENLFKIKLASDVDVNKGINFYRQRSDTESWIPGGTTFQAGTNLYKMTDWAGDNQWTGEWDGSWYVESLAGQTMAFENKSGAALSGVKARFYSSTSNSPIATVDVGTGSIADGAYATFQIPENYGSYVQFVTPDDNILGDQFSYFLGEGVGESNVESFVYNSTTKYCYKYKTDASDSTWGVPGDGVLISDAEQLKEFLTGDGVVGILATDFACSTAITVNGDKTLNLNGKTITSSVEKLFTVGSGATLTITDNVVVTDSKTTAGGNKYGRQGSMTDYALTYYVTESTASETATTETLYQHTVDFGSAGKIVSSSTGDNVINVTGGTLNLEGGVISSNGSHAVVLDTTNGGNMNMSGGLIKGKNGTADGAGIYMGSGNLNMSGGYIAGGASNKGGGIYMNSGTINLTDDAVIAANKATSNGAGGGIYVNSGVLNLHGGTVASNWVDSGNDSNGGGIYVESGTISMTDGYVTNNSQYGGRNNAYCQNGGGGIAFDAAQMYMSGGYITGNYAEEAGGGVYAGFWHNNDIGARFVMSGGTVASNYAKNGEGGGIRISGGTEGVVSGPSGSTVYITNNTTMTKNDWGGGGIMVQTGGTFNIMDVLITNNHAEGFGGGVASCPSGGVDAVSDKGAAIFGNEAECRVVRPGGEKIYDVEFKSSYEGQVEGGFTDTDVQDYFCTNQQDANELMLGGGEENWTGPGKSPGDRTNMPWSIEDDGEPHDVMALTAYPTETAKDAAKAAASVIISGNWSHTHGGGITTNGTLDMGKTTRTEIGTSLTINATKQVMKAAGGVQTTDLPPFEFVLLNKKPTWNPATKQFDYAEDTKVLQTKTNGGDGDISFDAIDYNIAAAAYYTYYLIENPTTTVKGTYEQDPTLYTIGVMVKSTTTTIDTTKTTTYTIEKVELKLEQNGVSIGSKAGNLVDLGNNEKSITLTDLNGKTTFNNKEVVPYSLPSTGGAGTTPYTTGGLLLMVSASALLLYNHQKRRKEATASS